ncbi:hypothetical protein HQ487_03355 [Candidatus Uhrbacteria bacterium]|nr:hypothetical protein [Candidatus Uhrbacteria bacterium]
MNRKGFSLIETVLYIGLLAILLPSFVMVTLGFVQKSEVVDPKIRMEEKVAVIFSQLQYELTGAESIDLTGSSLGIDDSSFVFVDREGVTVTVERTADAVSFLEGDQFVNRLTWGTVAGSEWMTDADMDAEVWNVAIVRDGGGVLTGVNVLLTLRGLNPDGSPYRDIEFTADTTISLQAFTTEL